MNYADMSPEQRASIDATAEMLKTDAHPTLSDKSDRAQEMATEFSAEEMAEETAKLEAKYDESVNEAMMLAGKSTDTDTGKAFFDTLMAEKEAYIKAAISQTMFEKQPLADAEARLVKIMQAAQSN